MRISLSRQKFALYDWIVGANVHPYLYDFYPDKVVKGVSESFGDAVGPFSSDLAMDVHMQAQEDFQA